VSYQGSGVFRVAAGDHRQDATIQRVDTGVPRVRRKRGHLAVLEIPRGLDDDAFVDAVAEQLRDLHTQLAAQPPTAARPSEPAADDDPPAEPPDMSARKGGPLIDVEGSAAIFEERRHATLLEAGFGRGR
jgi:hypothetical protein